MNVLDLILTQNLDVVPTQEDGDLLSKGEKGFEDILEKYLGDSKEFIKKRSSFDGDLSSTKPSFYEMLQGINLHKLKMEMVNKEKSQFDKDKITFLLKKLSDKKNITFTENNLQKFSIKGDIKSNIVNLKSNRDIIGKKLSNNQLKVDIVKKRTNSKEVAINQYKNLQKQKPSLKNGEVKQNQNIDLSKNTLLFNKDYINESDETLTDLVKINFTDESRVLDSSKLVTNSKLGAIGANSKLGANSNLVANSSSKFSKNHLHNTFDKNRKNITGVNSKSLVSKKSKSAVLYKIKKDRLDEKITKNSLKRRAENESFYEEIMQESTPKVKVEFRDVLVNGTSQQNRQDFKIEFISSDGQGSDFNDYEHSEDIHTHLSYKRDDSAEINSKKFHNSLMFHFEKTKVRVNVLNSKLYLNFFSNEPIRLNNTSEVEHIMTEHGFEEYDIRLKDGQKSINITSKEKKYASTALKRGMVDVKV